MIRASTVASSLPAFLVLLQALLLTTVFGQGFYESPSSPVKELTAHSFRRDVIESKKPILVEFYAPWCGHCKNLKPEYLKTATRLQGLVDVAALNCDDEANKPICAQNGVRGFPTIKLFRPAKMSKDLILSARSFKDDDLNAGNVKKPRPQPPLIEEYTSGVRNAQEISKFALSRLQNYVTTVSDKSELDDFLSQEPDYTSKVVLLSARRSADQPAGIPSLYKVLAMEFIHAPFAYVPPIKSCQKLYRQLIPEVPLGTDGLLEKSVLLVLNGDDEPPLIYVGQMDHDSLYDFLEASVAGTVATSTDASKPRSKAKHQPNWKDQLKPKTLAVKTLLSDKDFESVCLSQSKPCIITTTQRGRTSLEKDAKFLESADSFVFVYLDIKQESGDELAKLLKLHPYGEQFGYVSCVDGWISAVDQLSTLHRIIAKGKKPKNSVSLSGFKGVSEENVDTKANVNANVKDEL